VVVVSVVSVVVVGLVMVMAMVMVMVMGAVVVGRWEGWAGTAGALSPSAGAASNQRGRYRC